MTPTDLLDLIVTKAPELRAAGVLHVQLDGLAFALAPQEHAPVVAEEEDKNGQQGGARPDPLDDEDTFGGPVPGFRRQPHEEHRR